MILAYIISNSEEEAEDLSRKLIEKRLVHSVNLIPGVKSLLRQGDQIVEEQRTLVLAKTKALLFRELEAEIEKFQARSTQTLFSMPLTQMSQTLFDLIQENTLKV